MKGVMGFGKKGKLSSRYVGLYEIVKHVEKLAYDLNLTSKLARINLVFYVSV